MFSWMKRRREKVCDVCHKRPPDAKAMVPPGYDLICAECSDVYFAKHPLAMSADGIMGLIREGMDELTDSARNAAGNTWGVSPDDFKDPDKEYGTDDDRIILPKPSLEGFQPPKYRKCKRCQSRSGASRRKDPVRPVVPGTMTCAECAAETSVSKPKKCLRCGKKKLLVTFINCAECIVEMDIAGKASDRQWKEHKVELKKRGLCLDCGKRPVVGEEYMKGDGWKEFPYIVAYHLDRDDSTEGQIKAARFMVEQGSKTCLPCLNSREVEEAARTTRRMLRKEAEDDLKAKRPGW